MKTFNVYKYPNPKTYATCVEVATDAPLPQPPWERMTEDEFNAWRAAQTPIVADPAPIDHVSKDVVIRRIRAAGKLTEMRTLLASMTPNQQFEFTQLTMLDPSREDLRNGIRQLGLDPDVILAP